MITTDVRTMDELKNSLKMQSGFIRIVDSELAQKVRDLSLISGPLTLGLFCYTLFKTRYRITEDNDGVVILKLLGSSF